MERFKESRLVFPLHHRMTMTGHYWQNMLWQTLWTWYCHFMRFFITYLQTMMIRITERLNQSEGEVKITKRHQTSPHLQNYPAGLPLHYCTSSFFFQQIVSWDLETWDCHHQTFSKPETSLILLCCRGGGAIWQNWGSLVFSWFFLPLMIIW